MDLNTQQQYQQAAMAQRIGYDFNDPKLLRTALTHRSYAHENNERLEFLGDAVLSCIIGEELYKLFPRAQEGQLSRLRAYLVRGTTLAEVARALGLGEALLLGQGELKSGGADRKSILENALEALIGAIYLDSDLATCRGCVERWYAERLQNLSLNDNVRDAKSFLQEWAQAAGHDMPCYEVLKIEGAEHCQTFHVRCEIQALSQAAEAQGTNRKMAEQAAAGQLIQQLGLN